MEICRADFAVQGQLQHGVMLFCLFQKILPHILITNTILFFKLSVFRPFTRLQRSTFFHELVGIYSFDVTYLRSHATMWNLEVLED